MNKPIRSATLIGAGNLAWSLIPNLQLAGIEVRQLITRSVERGKEYQARFEIPQLHSAIDKLDDSADLIILTVSDQAIGSIAKRLSKQGIGEAICVHTSGSISLKELAILGGNVGVFYPMQTFTRDRITPYQDVPMFVEGNPQVEARLLPLAQALSTKVYRLNSADRLKLHLGAVWACNFTNYLFRVAHQVMPTHTDLDFSIYEPLVREHIDKVFRFQPENTQTGPAIRADQPTLQKHLEILESKEELQSLYKELSLRIRGDLSL